MTTRPDPSSGTAAVTTDNEESTVMIRGVLDQGAPWIVRGTDWPRVPDPHDDGGSRRFRVLLPYNGAVAARAALEVVSELVSGRSPLVWVLYVRHWDAVRGGNRFCLETLEEAWHGTHPAVAELRRRGIPASGVVRDAARERVGQAIVGEAARLDVGCIVLGTHAHGALVSALTGSVPRQVARAADRPIVLARASDHPRHKLSLRARRVPWSDT